MAVRTTQPRAKRRKPPKYNVFISHATADKWVAIQMCRLIEETGASTFRDDRDIAGGDDIPDSIRKAIGQSRDFVVLLSPKSATRPWVQIETGAAWAKGRRIVFILLHLDADSMPGTFKDKKAFHINDFDAYVRELSRRVRGGAA